MYLHETGLASRKLPKRIISLVPSQTELLFDLGLEEETVGITKFCVHPTHWFRNKARVGGTKTVDINKVKALKPDLIIANKEENVQAQVVALASIAPVWVSDIQHLDDALDMIRSIGELTGTTQKAWALAGEIEQQFQFLGNTVNPKKTLYLIWQNPWMTVGGDTFISDIMTRAGLLNTFQERTRYPEITIQDMQQNNPELVLLSSEPFPFKDKHVRALQTELPNAKIVLVDGELFSWYGSRLLYTVPYLSKLLAQK